MVELGCLKKQKGRKDMISEAQRKFKGYVYDKGYFFLQQERHLVGKLYKRPRPTVVMQCGFLGMATLDLARAGYIEAPLLKTLKLEEVVDYAKTAIKEYEKCAKKGTLMYNKEQ